MKLRLLSALYVLVLLPMCLHAQAPQAFQRFASRFPEGMNANWRTINYETMVALPHNEVKKFVLDPMLARIQTDPQFGAIQERVSPDFWDSERNYLVPDSIYNLMEYFPLGRTTYDRYSILLIGFSNTSVIAIFSQEGQFIDCISGSANIGACVVSAEYELKWHNGHFSRHGSRFLDYPFTWPLDDAPCKKCHQHFSEYFSIGNNGRIIRDSLHFTSFHGMYVDTSSGEWICLAERYEEASVAYRGSETKPWMFPIVQRVDSASRSLTIHFTNSPTKYTLQLNRDGRTLTCTASDGTAPQTFIYRQIEVRY